MPPFNGRVDSMDSLLLTHLAIALLAAVPVAALIVHVLHKAPGSVRNTALEIYRRQLSEIDRDAASGQIGEEEAKSTRNAVARRMLAADRDFRNSPTPGTAPRRATRALSIVVILALVPGSILVYLIVGQPGTPDQPIAKRLEAIENLRATRPTQQEALQMQESPSVAVEAFDPEYLGLVDQLRAAVADKPNDPEGLRLLAFHESRLGIHTAAAQHQERLLELLAEDATAEDYAQLAEYLILAASGYVSPEAEDAIDAALRINPRQVQARFYAGLAHAQIGRSDLAFAVWHKLSEFEETPETMLVALSELLPAVALQAGIRYTVPPRFDSGPTSEQIESAAQLTGEQRQQMIEDMVAGLESRIKQKGGSAEEYARLIWSLHVLGRTQRAGETWLEAKDLFMDDEAAMTLLERTAGSAGLLQ
ncbi:MAG: c-type cytochrome biogenesis protein CcmI [Rhodobacteraceae bacterium]|nr:c-type cytochrome biogenesis protein CcmI [Paracoccaceae bacterium]